MAVLTEVQKKKKPTTTTTLFEPQATKDPVTTTTETQVAKQPVTQTTSVAPITEQQAVKPPAQDQHTEQQAVRTPTTTFTPATTSDPKQDAVQRLLAGGRDHFDLQREQIEADAAAQAEARRDAITRQLASQGIDDSGIALAQQRQASVDSSIARSRALGNVNIEELRTLEGRAAEDRQRDFLREQAGLDRGLTREGFQLQRDLAAEGFKLEEAKLELQRQGMSQQDAQFYAALNQAGDLARKGLSLQEIGLDLQRQGLSQQDAQFYAGLAQAGELARAGLSLEEQKINLQEQGMNQQDAQFYAGLAQAGELATRGMDLEEIKIGLMEQGMNLEDARFYANIAHEQSLQGSDITASIQRAVIVDLMAKIDPKDSNYLIQLNQILDSIGLNQLTDSGQSGQGAFTIGGQNIDLSRASEEEMKTIGFLGENDVILSRSPDGVTVRRLEFNGQTGQTEYVEHFIPYPT